MRDDLTGKRFSHLLVIGKWVGFDKPSGWLCECSCGQKAFARTHDLVHHKKVSCGHVRTEQNNRNRFRLTQTKNGRLLSLTSGSDFGWSIDDALDDLVGG